MLRHILYKFIAGVGQVNMKSNRKQRKTNAGNGHLRAIKSRFGRPVRFALAVRLDGWQNSAQAHVTANS